MIVLSIKIAFCRQNETDNSMKTMTAVGFEPTPPK